MTLMIIDYTLARNSPKKASLACICIDCGDYVWWKFFIHFCVGRNWVRDHELLDNMCYQMRPRPPTFWKAPLLLPSQISKGVVFQIINLGLFAFIINFEGLLKKGKIHSLCFIYDSPSGGSIWTYWALSGPDALQKGRSWNWILCHVFSISSKKMLFNNLFFQKHQVGR